MTKPTIELLNTVDTKKLHYSYTLNGKLVSVNYQDRTEEQRKAARIMGTKWAYYRQMSAQSRMNAVSDDWSAFCKEVREAATQGEQEAAPEQVAVTELTPALAQEAKDLNAGGIDLDIIFATLTRRNAIDMQLHDFIQQVHAYLPEPCEPVRAVIAPRRLVTSTRRRYQSFDMFVGAQWVTAYYKRGIQISLKTWPTKPTDRQLRAFRKEAQKEVRRNNL